MIRLQFLHGRFRDAFDAAARVRRQLVHEVIRQKRNILLALAQRRNVDGHDVEAVVEILAEGTLLERGA